MEKSKPYVNVTEESFSYDGGSAAKHDTNDQWNPGFWARFPWIGFASLFTVLLCSGASATVLVTSNGKSQSSWPEKAAPNILLNIFNNIANICFATAIGNGIAIAWWRRTLQGASIQELHRSWSFSTSLLQVILSLKYFDVIALGALTAKLTIIDGTLMQKATSTQTMMNLPVNVTNIQGFANETWGANGQVSGHSGATPSLLSPWFNDDLKIWSQTGGVFPNHWDGCNGVCFLNIPAIGFAFECTTANKSAMNYGHETRRATDLTSTGNWTRNSTLPPLCAGSVPSTF